MIIADREVSLPSERRAPMLNPASGLLGARRPADFFNFIARDR